MNIVKFLYIVNLISALFAHGDGDHKHDRGKPSGCVIYGTILDSITNKPIEYVSISVINSQGVQVILLLDDILSAGSYSITWNASDYSSGIYIVRMEAGEYSDSQKLILIK